MAKTAVGKVAEAAVEHQTHTLIEKAVAQLETFGSSIAQAATVGKRRKYVLAALAALIIAGKAADTIRTSMAAKSRTSARKGARKSARKAKTAKRSAR